MERPSMDDSSSSFLRLEMSGAMIQSPRLGRKLWQMKLEQMEEEEIMFGHYDDEASSGQESHDTDSASSSSPPSSVSEQASTISKDLAHNDNQTEAGIEAEIEAGIEGGIEAEIEAGLEPPSSSAAKGIPVKLQSLERSGSQRSLTLVDVAEAPPAPTPTTAARNTVLNKLHAPTPQSKSRALLLHSSPMIIECITEEPAEADESLSPCQRVWKRTHAIYARNEVFILMILAILLARAYPPVGATYLYPSITSAWIAVVFIFLLAGLGLRSDEFSKALQRFKFNLFIQVFSFGVISIYVFGVSRALIKADALEESLANGMVICACLPMTISSVIVLTKASGGDEAAAVFNSAFGSMLSVFLSPLLILAYLGVGGNVNALAMCYKLALRVVAPVMVGQILQKTSPCAIEFVGKYQRFFRSAQLYAVVWIVYTVFCRTFESGSSAKLVDIATMIAMQTLFLVTFMALSWVSMQYLFPNEPRLRVMGLFGTTQKTMAMGVPMIGAIYENDPRVALYTLPLLVWYPLQLIVGSFLSPYLKSFADREKWRLLLESGKGNNNKSEVDSIHAVRPDWESTGSLSLKSESITSRRRATNVSLAGESDPETNSTASSNDDLDNEQPVHESFDEFLMFSSCPRRKDIRRQDTDNGAEELAPPVRGARSIESCSDVESELAHSFSNASVVSSVSVPPTATPPPL